MTTSYTTGHYHTRFPTPALAQAWADVQEATDFLYYLGKYTDRPWWPGYAGTAIRALYVHRSRDPIPCRLCGGTGLQPVTGNGRCVCTTVRVTRLDEDGNPTGPSLVSHGVHVGLG